MSPVSKRTQRRLIVEWSDEQVRTETPPDGLEPDEAVWFAALLETGAEQIVNRRDD